MQNAVLKKTSSRINLSGGLNIGDSIWIPNVYTQDEKDEPFFLAKIDQIFKEKSQYEVSILQTKKSAIVKFDEALKFINSIEINVDDMQTVEDINQMDLFNNLKNRFSKNIIFTNVGQTLIIVNPYKDVKCFEQDTISNYISTFKQIKEIQKTLLSLNKKSILERRVSLKTNEAQNNLIPSRISLLKRNSLNNVRASKLPKLQELQPHLYKLVLSVIDNLQSMRCPQNILISGESGAGKTETAKNAIKFITKFFENNKKSRKSIISFEEKSLAISLEEQIQKCNPILEAFGNAKTKNNDNSSRFGKFISIKIDVENKIIEGAEISTFLLEKTRLVFPGEKERNFHVFYYILKGADDQLIELLNLSRDPKTFNYLKVTGCYEINNVQDSQQFLELIEAFVFNGFSNQELLYIFRILAAILHLGNVEFEENTIDNQSEASTINNANNYKSDALVRIKDNSEKEILNNIAMLIDIDEAQLEETLTMKTLKIQKDEFKKPLTIQEAYASRDVLAKEIYSRLFNWIVKKLNFNLKQTYSNKNNSDVKNSDNNINDKQNKNNENIFSIGILDIFGFESFSVNSFEQFCINFSNEKLQQLFILDNFKSDEQEFINEGLENLISSFNFKDNKEIIDLFEKEKEGIFRILDDTCKLKQQDSNFCNNILSNHSNNKNIKISKINKNLIGINHTAKTIDYTITGFVNKNLDDANEAIVKNFLIKADEIPMICLVFFNFLNEDEYKKFLNETENAGDNSNNNNNNNKNNNRSQQELKFLGYKFRKDFDLLVNEIKLSQRHYIRCLKPNEDKQKDLLVPGCLYRQINYLGILDSIKIRKQNFPIRKNYKDFFIMCYDFYELLFYKWVNKGQIKPNELDIIDRSFLFPNNSKILNLNEDENYRNVNLENPNKETIEKFKKLSLIILDFFFNNQEIQKENNDKIYLIGKNKIFMIDNFINLIEDTKSIYLITQISNANRIGDAWLRYKFFEKLKKLSFKIGMFAYKSFLTKKHFGKICRNKIRYYFMKSITLKVKQSNKNIRISKMICAHLFFKKIKNFIQTKKIYNVCQENTNYIINNTWNSLIEHLRIKAAIKIQNHIRSYFTKIKYSEIVLKGKKKRQQIKQEISALIIQTSFRRYWKFKQIKKIRLILKKFSGAFKIEFYQKKLNRMKNSCEIIRKRFVMFRLRKQIIKERLEAYLEEEKLYYISKKRILEANKEQSSICSSAKNLSPYKNNKINLYNIDNINGNELKINYDNNRNILSYNTGKITNNSNTIFNSNSNNLSLRGINNNNIASNNNLLKLTSLSKLIKEAGSQFKQERVKDYGLPFFDYYEDPKISLFIKILDFDEIIDTIEVYKTSWLKEFEKLNNNSIKNNTPLQYISTSDSHSVVINNKYKAYFWGLNDYGQCGVKSEETNPNLLTINYPIRNPDLTAVIPEKNYKENSSAFTNYADKFSANFISALTGEEYSIIVDETGNAYSFGDNSKGQLILGNELISRKINHIKDFANNVKEIKSTGHSNIILTKDEKVFEFEFENNINFQDKNKKKNINIFRSLNANSKLNITNVSCGKNFCILLTKQGILYSVGIKNTHGELGLGDFKPKNEPQIIKSLIDLKEKIIQVECGFKHVIARSTVGKVYSWGNNCHGQLGLGDYDKKVNKPCQIKFEKSMKANKKITQITTGFRQSFFLNEDRQIFYCGYNSLNNQESHVSENQVNCEYYTSNKSFISKRNIFYPTQLDYKIKLPYLKNESEFQIVKINSSWNKLFSAFYITIADVRNLYQKMNNINKLNMILDTLANKWDSKGNSVNPPYIETIANYFHSSVMKKTFFNEDIKISSKK